MRNLYIYHLCKSLEHAAAAERWEQVKDLCAALRRQCQTMEFTA